MAKKEAGFVQALSGEHAWFTDFIVAEHYLKNGNRQRALEAYQRSYRAIEQLPQNSQQIGDWLVIDRVRARLYELNATDKPPEKAGNPDSNNIE